MHQTHPTYTSVGVLLALALAAPGVSLAYGDKDAIRDCESHIQSEYDLSDLRDARAERLMDSEHHYKVQGIAKVDGDKHPWTCEVKNRHVTAAEYSGPKPKGMTTAQKLAIGAAAAVAAGVAINAMSKDDEEGAMQGKETPSSSGDAKVPGTEFNATGEVPCARHRGQPMSQCRFGVVREGGGSGWIKIFWPDGGSRVIFFEKGTPSRYDESQADGGAQMSVRLEEDLYRVRVGDQRFEFPEALLLGD